MSVGDTRKAKTWREKKGKIWGIIKTACCMLPEAQEIFVARRAKTMKLRTSPGDG